MQRSRYGGGGGGGGEEGAPPAASDGMVDVTFHTAEWHAGGSPGRPMASHPNSLPEGTAG